MILRLFAALLRSQPSRRAAQRSPRRRSARKFSGTSGACPTSYAKTDEDLFYALGWASMHNHAQVILRLYGQARGRAAEYWGETWLSSDQQVRLLRIPERATAALAAQTPAFRRKLEAFVDGVNAYAAAHPEKVTEEFAPFCRSRRSIF